MRSFLLFWVILLASLPAFPQPILSTVYSYTHAPAVNQPGYEEQTLAEGTTRDFSHVIVQAITIGANQPTQPTQQLDEEAILIIKTGELTLTLGSKHKTLGPGSVVIIMPGDDYQIENKATPSLTYYQIRYTSNEMPDLDLYQLVGGSFWVDWKELATTTNQQGNDQRLVPYPTVMSNRMAIQVARVVSGLGKNLPHMHRAAELLFILDHPVQTQIEGTSHRAHTGDLIFVESDVPHSINTSRPEGGTYLSIQF